MNNKYIINGFSYLGKDERRKYLISLEEFIVLKLMEPFIRCIKNVITDNFFRSGHKVAKNTTIVGTIRGNKRELPKLAKERKDKMTLFSSKLYKSNYICLIAYKSKPTKKKCLCISFMHKSMQKSKKVTNIYRKWLVFIIIQNLVLDVADQARKYNVKSKSCRYHLQIFFNILDIACMFLYNGFV